MMAVGLASGSLGFVLAFGTLMLLRGSYRPARIVRRHLAHEIADGVRSLWSQPLLRTIALMAAVINGCWTGWAAVFVLYAVEPGPMGLTTNAWLVGVAVLIGGVGGLMWGIAATSLQQRVVPDELRGRVSAVYRFIGFGALSLGALLGGLLAELLGIRAVFAVTAALTLLTLIPFARVVTEAGMRDGV